MKSLKKFTVIDSIQRFFLIVICLLLTIEIINTIVFGLFPLMSLWNRILFDVILNSIILSPILYFLVFRPWTEHLAERKQAEAALRTSEAKYSGLIEQSLDGIVITDEDGNIAVWNKSIESITGLLQSDVVGVPLWEIQSLMIPKDLVTPERVEEMQKSIQNIIENKIDWPGMKSEHTIVCTDGVRKVIQDSSFVIKTGNSIVFGAIVHDITNRKNAEEELQSSEKKYRFMFEKNPQVMFIYDLETLAFLEVNQAAIDHYGYSKAEFLSMTIMDIRPEEDIPALLQDVEQNNRHDQGFIPKVKWRHIKKNGELIFVEIRAHSVIYEGRIARHILVNDISEKTKAEEKLRESESQNRALINAIPDLIFTNHRDGEYLAVHVSDSNLLLHKPEKFLHRKLEEVLPKSLAGQFLKAFADALDLNKVQLVNYTLSINGVEKYFEARIVPCAKDEVISIVRDVTERKNAEKALRDGEERYHTVVSNAPLIIFATDENGMFILSEGMGLTKLGLQPGQVVGLSIFDVYRDYPSIIDAMKNALTGQSQRNEFEVKGIVFDAFFSPVFDQQGNVVKVIGVSTDITERKNAEETLRNAQKIKSIGLLSSGIAHDYNNLLNIMMGNITLATKKISVDHQAVKFLERSLSAMQSAAILTKQILAYSGKGRFQMKAIDMVVMVQDRLDLLKISLPKKITLQTELSPTPVFVKGDPGQIEQIVMNLMINAGESIGENQGIVSIEVSAVTLTNEELSVYSTLTNTTLNGGDYACLRVSDNGSGMNNETMEKIFDPFFTTKFVGRGLGLSAVLGIIRGHTGGITVNSTEDVGTTICVLLPIVQPVAPAIIPLNEEPTPLHVSGKTILLIDDEKDIIEMLNNVLESGNYFRHSATDPEVGVRLYEKHWRTIDLVILDYSMPKMNGKEVLIELRKINPKVKIIISTGYSEEEIMNLLGKFKPTSFIQKPYTANALLSIVRTVLETE